MVWQGRCASGLEAHFAKYFMNWHVGHIKSENVGILHNLQMHPNSGIIITVLHATVDIDHI